MAAGSGWAFVDGRDEHAKDYEDQAPQTIAVLPFADRGSANYIVNKVPLTHRNKDERAKWAWTDANRLRRAMDAYRAPREFQEANLIQVDTILKQHGIDSAEKLEQVPPQTLGKWLGVVVGGHMRYYGVPMNMPALFLFRSQVGWLWHRALSRRSQNGHVDWDRMRRLIDRWLPPLRIYHPYPLHRFFGVVT